MRSVTLNVCRRQGRHSMEELAQRRQLKPVSWCILNLTWLLTIKDNVEKCHQWMLESGVGSWMQECQLLSTSSLSPLFLPPHPPLWWQWCVGLSISLSQAYAAVTGGARSLPATPSYFAFRRRLPLQPWRLAGKQSMRCSRSAMVGSMLWWLIKRFTDDATSWRHACASRYVRSRRFGSSCTGASAARPPNLPQNDLSCSAAFVRTPLGSLPIYPNPGRLGYITDVWTNEAVD